MMIALVAGFPGENLFTDDFTAEYFTVGGEQRAGQPIPNPLPVDLRPLQLSQLLFHQSDWSSEEFWQNLFHANDQEEGKVEKAVKVQKMEGRS